MIQNGILFKENRGCNLIGRILISHISQYRFKSDQLHDRYIFIFIFLSILDQIIKINILLINKYNIYFNFKLIDIKIIYVINKGFIWGIGYNNGFIISVLLYLLLLILISYIIIFYKYFLLEWVSFSCGAISNFYDRFSKNYVIDYISFNVYIFNIELNCPIFNIADVLICISIIFFILKKYKMII